MAAGVLKAGSSVVIVLAFKVKPFGDWCNTGKGIGYGFFRCCISFFCGLRSPHVNKLVNKLYFLPERVYL